MTNTNPVALGYVTIISVMEAIAASSNPDRAEVLRQMRRAPRSAR